MLIDVCGTGRTSVSRSRAAGLWQMQKLADHSLLPAVLSHLDTLQDVVRCSVVSKTWQAAMPEAQLTCLIIPGYTYNGSKTGLLDTVGMASALTWIQSQNQEGPLRNVEYLSLQLNCGCTRDCYEGKTIADFCQLVLIQAAAWPLKMCYIDGPFDVSLATPLLSPSLHHVSLNPRPDSMPRHLSLSMFERIPELQTLVIKTCIGDGLESCPVDSAACFLLQSTLPKLTSLYLCPWKLHFAPGCNLRTCLPKLRYVVVHVPADQAQVVADLDGLEWLGLVLHNTQQQRAYLMILEGHSLQQLTVYPAVNERLHFIVQKPDLDFHIDSDIIVEKGTQPEFEFDVPCFTDMGFSEMTFNHFSWRW